MKRAELNAQKQAIRDEIEAMQKKLRSALVEKSAIPKQVIDAPLSAIQEFKSDCESAAKIYHVLNKPGKTKTVDQLLKIKARIHLQAKKLWIV